LGKEEAGRRGEKRGREAMKGNMMLKCRVSAEKSIVPDAPLEMYNEI
jgi:hypothetical protein